jgi:ADP-ribose pyrophosphatase YjhB (NUDIX family)
VSIAVFRSGQVLVVQRATSPFAGAFSLPGGLVETGETLEEAALRELREECQIDARLIAFNRHVEWIDRDREGRVQYHYVIASFAGEWTAGEASPGPEVADAIWVGPARLAALICTPHLPEVIGAAKGLLDARCGSVALRP